MTVSLSIHYSPILQVLLYLKGTLFHDLHFSYHSSLDLRTCVLRCWLDKWSHIPIGIGPPQVINLCRVIPSSLGVSSCGNRSAIQIAHNDVFHEHTKDIEVDCHFVLHHLLHGTLHLYPIASIDQPANVLAKTHSPRHIFRLF
jgi:hypothetical protein